MRQRFTPIVVQAPQRSEAWFKSRLGNVTASEVSKTMEYYAVGKTDLTKAIEYYRLNAASYSQDWTEKMLTKYPKEFCLRAGIKLRESASRTNYRQAKVTERITGMPADLDPYITKDMLWGQAQEPDARHLYSLITKNRVQDAPFMMHPEMMCGASPDGLVIDVTTGELGTVEIKCLKSTNHLYKIIRSEEVPEDYHDQIQMQMWMTGRDWCDFVAYDSRVGGNLNLFIKRVEYDEFYVEEVLVPSIERFLDECDADERKFYAIAKSKQEEKSNAV